MFPSDERSLFNFRVLLLPEPEYQMEHSLLLIMKAY